MIYIYSVCPLNATSREIYTYTYIYSMHLKLPLETSNTGLKVFV